MLGAVLIAAVMAGGAGLAAALEVPKLRAPVEDQAGLLRPEERAALNARLVAYRRNVGHSYALLTLPSLEGEAIEDLTMRVVERWQLGDKKEDNGLLFFIAVKEKRMRIEVGYGLEGEIPDALTGRILRDVVQPAFRQGKMAEGIFKAFELLMRAGEGKKVALPPAGGQGGRPGAWPLFLLLGLVLMALVVSPRGQRGRRSFVGSGLGGFGGFGGFGGGGFGGGGGGFGGGFGGGGGGFGGGGASGSW